MFVYTVLVKQLFIFSFNTIPILSFYSKNKNPQEFKILDSCGFFTNFYKVIMFAKF